jgi:hypothetical protein
MNKSMPAFRQWDFRAFCGFEKSWRGHHPMEAEDEKAFDESRNRWHDACDRTRKPTNFNHGQNSLEK